MTGSESYHCTRSPIPDFYRHATHTRITEPVLHHGITVLHIHMTRSESDHQITVPQQATQADNRYTHTHNWAESHHHITVPKQAKLAHKNTSG